MPLKNTSAALIDGIEPFHEAHQQTGIRGRSEVVLDEDVEAVGKAEFAEVGESIDRPLDQLLGFGGVARRARILAAPVDADRVAPQVGGDINPLFDIAGGFHPFFLGWGAERTFPVDHDERNRDAVLG